MTNKEQFLSQIKWDKNGLIACVAQDHISKRVLMLAYMNLESLKLTLRVKKCHYWSRSRKKLWFKGEQSGHIQILHRIFFDCDLDAIVAFVEQVGNASCHTGMESCFYREYDFSSSDLKIIDNPIFDPKTVY